MKHRNQLIGILFLSAFPLYGIGSSLLESVSDSAGLGLALVFANSLVVLIIGRLLQTIATPHSKLVANIYLTARLQEAFFLVIYASLVYNGADADSAVYDLYRIAMVGLGLGSLPLLLTLTNVQVIPTWLGRFGLVGYISVICGILADSVGAVDLGLGLMIPGALFEVTFAYWFIVRGVADDDYEMMN